MSLIGKSISSSVCKAIVSFLSSPSFKRTLILAFIMFVTMVLMMMTQVHVDNITVHLIKSQNKTFYEEPLHDMIHQVLPEILDPVPGINKPICDFLLLLLLLSTLFYAVLFHPKTRVQGDRLLLLRRFMAVMIVCFFLRIFTIMVTRLPGSGKYLFNTSMMIFKNSLFYLDPRCKVKSRTDGKFWKSAFFDEMDEICTDMVYSGHTCSVIVALWIWLHQNPRNWLLKLYAFLHAFACILFFLINRLHYSVDIIVGIYVSGGVCLAYSLGKAGKMKE